METAHRSDRAEQLFYHQGYISWSPSETSKQIQFVNKKGSWMLWLVLCNAIAEGFCWSLSALSRLRIIVKMRWARGLAWPGPCKDRPFYSSSLTNRAEWNQVTLHTYLGLLQHNNATHLSCHLKLIALVKLFLHDKQTAHFATPSSRSQTGIKCAVFCC
jgi:hypothetical protein